MYLRIIIIGILFYLFYRLLRGGGKKERAVPPGSGRPEELPAHDVLVRDPVCQIYIPKGQALVLQEKDGPVHFCSETCRQAYLASGGRNESEK